jgi:hypothetical protein
MSANSTSLKAIPSDWISRRGPANGVTELTARLRLRVADEEVGVLKVAGGAAEIGPDGEADATLDVDTLQTLVGLLGGEVHPIVARLQNRVRVEGDVAEAVRVFLGLQAGSPWSGLVSRSERNA